MRMCSRVIIAVLIAAFLVLPSAVVSQQLAVSMERTVLPGVATIHYAGKSLTFTTNVPVQIKFEMVSMTDVQVRFREHPTQSPPAAPMSEPSLLTIFWEDLGDNIFSGDPPNVDWGTIILTEGGWTEK